jgi:hypothetical protein
MCKQISKTTEDLEWQKMGHHIQHQVVGYHGLIKGEMPSKLRNNGHLIRKAPRQSTCNNRIHHLAMVTKRTGNLV